MNARAVWFTGPRTVEIRDEPVPPPGPGQVMIRAVASALSHGTEMLVYRGQASPDLPLDLPTLAGSFAFPIKYGYASVGRVDGVGEGVSGFSPGRLVFAQHPHQTAYTIPVNLAVPLPDGVRPESGVFLANLETAVNVLLDAPPVVGETVVIFGQGVVGLLLTQLVRQSPAARVLTVEPVPGRRAMSEAFGADRAMDPAGEDVAAAVFDSTNGRGADLVIEASGHPDALQAAVDVAGQEARVVVVSWYGEKPVGLRLGGAFHRRRLRLISSQVGQIPSTAGPRWDRTRRLAVATDLLTRLTLAPLITHAFPFERAAAAYALVDGGAEGVVQVILTYDHV